MQLLTTDSYHAALLKEIPRAKKRIVIAAMIIVWGDRTAPIFEALEKAAARGVKVTVLLDNYTRLMARYDSAARKTRNERVRRTFASLEELSRLGATVYCFGKLGIVPYKGRCHVKITVIDDTYYSFGGINLSDINLSCDDYMLKGQDHAIANRLHKLVDRIGVSTPPLPDTEAPLTKTSSLLFDGGRPGHSLIYERACELASRAKRIYIVTHFAPSGQLIKLLHETDATCYFSRPEQLMAPDAWGQAFDQQRYRLENAYTGANLIHAKFMLAELPSGQYASLCGSHNFSYRGVAFGTQEAALYSTDKAVWEQLYAFMQQVAKQR